MKVEVKLLESQLPERATPDIIEKYVDMALTVGVVKLGNMILDDDTNHADVIRAVQAATAVGRHLEQRKLSEQKDEGVEFDLDDDMRIKKHGEV